MDALETDLNRSGKRAQGEGLGQAWNAFEQDVTISDQRDKRRSMRYFWPTMTRPISWRKG